MNEIINNNNPIICKHLALHSDNAANRIIKYGEELMDALRKELARN
jgi:hypothetical protein